MGGDPLKETYKAPTIKVDQLHHAKIKENLHLLNEVKGVCLSSFSVAIINRMPEALQFIKNKGVFELMVSDSQIQGTRTCSTSTEGFMLLQKGLKAEGEVEKYKKIEKRAKFPG